MLREHRPQHLEPARPRGLRVRDGVVAGRIGGDPGQQRRLRQVEPRRRRVEVRLRGALDPVRAVPEVDRVQVGGEDAELLPALLQLPGERRLLELAADRPLRGDARVLDELLRDRRAALHDALARHVRPHGASDAAQVDAAVLVEALVLDRDDRLLHDRRDVLGLQEDAALRSAQRREDRVVVVRVDVSVDLVRHRPGSQFGIWLATAVISPKVNEATPSEQEDQEEGERGGASGSAAGVRSPHGNCLSG